MPLVSALSVMAAILVWQPLAPWRRLRARAPAHRSTTRVRLVPLLMGGVCAAIACGWVVDSARGAVLSLSVCTSLAVAVWTLDHSRRAKRRVRARDEVARGCSELAALLRAGHPPGRALRLVADGVPVFAEPAAYAAVGGELPAALQRVGSSPGCHGLHGLGGAWLIAERTGASLTSFLDDLAHNLAAERELGRTVDTELAAPRMSGRLLGILPVVGLALGFAIGGDPVAYLTGSLPGLACLGVGSCLAAGGVVWTEKLADRAGQVR